LTVLSRDLGTDAPRFKRPKISWEEGEPAGRRLPAESARPNGTYLAARCGRDREHLTNEADGSWRTSGAGDHGLFLADKGTLDGDGESTSDYLVHRLNPELAVAVGFVGFVAALLLQFSMRRYVAWTYWLGVVMVGVFGTMAADVLHVRFAVPYAVSSALYGVVLMAVFVSWQKTEKTMSIHTVDTPRREAFYWASVVATFAMARQWGTSRP